MTVNYKEMTVKQLMEVAKYMNIAGRHSMKKEELVEKIMELNYLKGQEGLKKQEEIKKKNAEKKVNSGEDVKRVMNSPKFKEVAKKGSDIIDHYIATSKKGPKKPIVIVENGEEIVFEKTYQASTYLAEKFEVKYSTIDRYLVNKLKNREPNLPKKLVGTDFESITFKYAE